MPLPSFYRSTDRARTWSVTRAAAYGAVIGALASAFKTFGPLHGTGAAPSLASGHLLASFVEIGGATLFFALLCAGAAGLRNFVAQRLIWDETR